jgi:hypothetical protein
LSQLRKLLGWGPGNVGGNNNILFLGHPKLILKISKQKASKI